MVVALIVQLLLILFYVKVLNVAVVCYLTNEMNPDRPAEDWSIGHLISPGCWDL